MVEPRDGALSMHNPDGDSASRRKMAGRRFEGLKILVVEDETIVAFLVEDMLLELGCAEVWHAGAVAQALALLQDRKPDASVLDVNLSGATAYPVADRLAQMGVPFVFASGYGPKGIAAEWQDRPIVQKPFDQETLVRALEAVIGG
jgi:CheY-like chemotaxis protein